MKKMMKMAAIVGGTGIIGYKIINSKIMRHMKSKFKSMANSITNKIREE